MTTIDDSALLESIRRKDPGAFEAFVDRFGGRILGFGLRVCGEREDARDVLQETLLKAYRSLETLEDPGALRSWLYRVATNACLMKRRKGKFEPDRELSLDELGPLGPRGVIAEIPDTTGLPDEELERHEMAAMVHRAIEELPPHYRIVLVLRDMEGLSTREVATSLGLAEPAVKMRLHRSRLMVRRSLETELARAAGAEEAPS